MSDGGMSNKEITDYFNDRNILTPNGKQYTQKNVWVTMKKYRNRLDRFNSFKVVEKTEKLILQQIQIITKPN